MLHAKIVDISKEKIDILKSEKFLSSANFGAIIYFVGTVRDLNGVVSGVIAPVKGSGNNERPWTTSTVSFDKLFPVFAQVCTSGTSNSGSSILAADIGYTHRVLDNSDDPYTSYLERNTLSITPEFYTESFKSIALLTQDDGSAATLNVKTISTKYMF